MDANISLFMIRDFFKAYFYHDLPWMQKYYNIEETGSIALLIAKLFS